MAEKCTKAASCNDDTLDKRLCVDVDRGERSRETEGLVKREELVGVQERELDGSSLGLGRSLVCSNIEEVDGLSTYAGHLFIRSEKGGIEHMERCNRPKSKPRKVEALSHGLVCSRNNGDTMMNFDGLQISSGFPEDRREESGNEIIEKGCHQKSRPKRTGCLKPTVKLGMGARQRSCGGLKKNKKKKSVSTNNKMANCSLESE
ncbi:hypothetical protein Ancab_028610 [Ancistrocladus abbreviatus]